MTGRRCTTLVLAALLAACGGRQPHAKAAPLHELKGVADLAAAFNADAGKPRVVLLLSPT